MSRNRIYQEIADRAKRSVYLTYTHHDVPTTTYKLFQPHSKRATVRKHGCQTRIELESFIHAHHTGAFVFFARMERYPVHIDPWMTNGAQCFDEVGNRNAVFIRHPDWATVWRMQWSVSVDDSVCRQT